MKANRTVERMQMPSLGLKELEVKQESLEAGISTGNRSCFHFGFREMTPTPGTVIIRKWLQIRRGSRGRLRATQFESPPK